MKKLLLVFVLLLSLVLITGCFGGGNTDDPTDRHAGHTDIWMLETNTVTCNRQHDGESFTVYQMCIDCNKEILNSYCIPCTALLLHAPDSNGYCSACGQYDVTFEVPNAASWEENGTLHTVVRDGNVISYTQKQGDNVLETYYTHNANPAGLLLYPDEISVKSYKNGRISEKYTLTIDCGEEFQALQDELNEVYAHLALDTAEIFERTSGDEREFTYEVEGATLSFAVPYNVYSCYRQNDDGSRGDLVASDVSTFNNELLSYVAATENGSITYNIINDAAPVTVPEKPEDSFYLALAKLEKYTLFCDEPYTVYQTETQTYDGQTMTGLTVAHSSKNSLKIEMDMDGHNTVFNFESRGNEIYVKAYMSGTLIYDDVADEFYTEIAEYGTLYGIYVSLYETLQTLDEHEILFEDGVVTLTDDEYPDSYVRIYIENETIVRTENCSTMMQDGKLLQDTIEYRIVYGEEQGDEDVTEP